MSLGEGAQVLKAGIGDRLGHRVWSTKRKMLPPRFPGDALGFGPTVALGLALGPGVGLAPEQLPSLPRGNAHRPSALHPLHLPVRVLFLKRVTPDPPLCARISYSLWALRKMAAAGLDEWTITTLLPLVRALS
jgi:hypothetical protein